MVEQISKSIHLSYQYLVGPTPSNKNPLMRLGVTSAVGVSVMNITHLFHSPVPMSIIGLGLAAVLVKQARQPLSYDTIDLKAMALGYDLIRKIRTLLLGGTVLMSGVMGALYLTSSLPESNNTLLKSYMLMSYVTLSTSCLSHLFHRRIANAIGVDHSVDTFKGIDSITP